MDRVHRIGQKKAVKVVRLIAKNIIEERVPDLQERKKRLTAARCQNWRQRTQVEPSVLGGDRGRRGKKNGVKTNHVRLPLCGPPS